MTKLTIICEVHFNAVGGLVKILLPPEPLSDFDYLAESHCD